MSKVKPSILVSGVVVAGLAALGWNYFSATSRGGAASVTVPRLSALASKGKVAFDANCAQCHGVNAAGTDKGPPLVHDIYNPGHHADAAFYFAAKNGVRQHHWSFGNMPPRPGVSKDDVTAIIRYIRELQVANGIRYRPHRM